MTTSPFSPSKTLKVLGRIDDCRRHLERLAPDIARRAQTPGPAADGYGVGRDSDAVGVAGGGVADPTASAATAWVPADELDQLYSAASEGMRLALVHLEAAKLAVDRAASLEADGKGRRIATSPCGVCGVEPASRRGMGNACYEAWRRASRPELVAWVDADGADRLRWDGIDPDRLTGDTRPGRKARA